MASKIRSWWQKTKKSIEVAVVGVLIIGFIALVIIIILGYIFNWSWTGLGPYSPPSKDSGFQPGKRLWDWLQLLIIPAVLAIGGYVFTYTTSRNDQAAIERRTIDEREAAEKRAQTEREIAQDYQHETALKEYFEKMSELLLHEKLRRSRPNAEVRKIARLWTFTILHRLDDFRKGNVLQFLHESDLIDKGNCIVDLSGADLTHAELSYLDLTNANLSKTVLIVANLLGAKLAGANLSEARLWGANLPDADLTGANLINASINFGLFEGEPPSNTSLYNANLTNANLSGARLCRTNLRKANLTGANLTLADLTGAIGTTPEQLATAKWLTDATMPDGKIHS
jgi:uncharacterized protein YjbI with pentapeptide repeats